MKKYIYCFIIIGILLAGCSQEKINFEKPNNTRVGVDSSTPTPVTQSSTPSPKSTNSQPPTPTPSPISEESVLPTTGDKPGNTTSSIAAIGSAATDGEWEYFWATSSYDYVLTEAKGNLCRMKADGTGCRILVQADACYINIVGDWVYFIEKENLYSTKGNIYRVKKSGGEKELIYDAVCTKMTVMGDTIFFINISDNSSIYSMKTNGTQALKLCDIADCRNLLYENQSLYFTAKKDNNTKVYKYNLTDRQLSEIYVEGMYVIDNGWIYYYEENFGICRAREDGTGKMELIQSPNSYVFINNSIIYLSSEIDEKEPNEAFGLRKIYRYDIDKNETIVIPNDNKERIFGFSGVAGDYIYYWVDYREYEDIKRMKFDGSENTNIFDKVARSVK